tara:strand:+ start:1145 stop:1372 length:228 start_codon:yes stop_codon:yes gene_type:complete
MAKAIIKFEYEVMPDEFSGNVVPLHEQPVAKLTTMLLDGSASFEEVCAEMTAFMRVIGFEINEHEELALLNSTEL